MSERLSFVIITLILFLAASLRMWELTSLPTGLSDDEIINIRIAETVRAGNVEVFYDLGDEGREGLYHIGAMVVTSAVGNGPLGYRLFAVWIGLLTTAMTYAVARRLTGYLGGLCAAGLITVSFWPVLLSRQILVEGMIPAFVAAVLLLLSVAFPIYRRRRIRNNTTSVSAMLGFVLGSAAYIHPAGLLILIFSLLFILYLVRVRHGVSQRRWSYISFTLLVLIIMSIPYLVSSVRNPALGGVERLLSDEPRFAAQAVVDGVSGLVLRGDEDALHNLPGRPLFDPFSALLLVGGIGVSIWRWREPRHALLLISMVVLSPIFLFSDQAPNFINYAAILPVLALFFAVGVTTLYASLPTSFRRLSAVGLLLLVIGNTLWTSNDLFTNWRDLPAVEQAFRSRLAQLASYTDRTAGDIPTVVCGWRADQSPTSPTLTDAQLFSLMLNRQQGANLRYVNCLRAMVMTNGGDQQQIILTDPNILTEAHPEIREWLAYGSLLTSPDLPSQSILSIHVEQALADRLGEFVSAPSVSYAPEAGGSAETPIRTPVSFGGNLTLLGYQVDGPQTYTQTETLRVISYWRTQGAVPPDLRLFTHILSDPGASPPANTDVLHLNPRLLRDRDVFLQITDVILPEALPPGDYQISIGGYQDSNDARLAVLDGGQERGTRLFLSTITVEAGTP
jgi:hypothetical protein